MQVSALTRTIPRVTAVVSLPVLKGVSSPTLKPVGMMRGASRMTWWGFVYRAVLNMLRQ